IMLYGCSPFGDRPADTLGLKPVMTLASELIGTQHLNVGERVGYGFAYEAVGEMTIGVVACGYADGYPRHAPTGTPVLVNGQRSPHRYSGSAVAALWLDEIDPKELDRTPTGEDELDRALGGGLVAGQVILLGGDPGIGKSTLLLQTVAGFAAQTSTLYVTGEESAEQVALRARRLALAAGGVRL